MVYNGERESGSWLPEGCLVVYSMYGNDQAFTVLKGDLVSWGTAGRYLTSSSFRSSG